MSCSELELPFAERWGGGGGGSSVMTASGVEQHCRLRAVVATSFNSFLLSCRVPVSLSPCLPLSLLLSVSSPSPTICFSSFSCCFFSYARSVVTSLGPLLYPSPRPRFSLLLLRVHLLPVHAHVLDLLMDASLWRWKEALFQYYCSLLITTAPNVGDGMSIYCFACMQTTKPTRCLAYTSCPDINPTRLFLK